MHFKGARNLSLWTNTPDLFSVVKLRGIYWPPKDTCFNRRGLEGDEKLKILHLLSKGLPFPKELSEDLT